MSDPPSSDDLRTARPLRHAKTWASSEGIELENGGRIEEVTVCYETWGTLNAAGDNAVLICH
ncbi:hypothetical protein MK280_05280, partial [Myxococcota bacterium]|nr:hypothetical protein [Myxococcota bacterium]